MRTQVTAPPPPSSTKPSAASTSPPLSDAEARSIAATLTREAHEAPALQDLLNQKTLLLLMVSWIGDQLASIEEQLDPAHRTAKPTPQGAFPSCSLTPTPTPTRESRPSAEAAAQPANFVRSSDLPAAAAVLTIRESDLPPLQPDQDNRESVPSPAATDLPSELPATAATAAAADPADSPLSAAAAAAAAICHPLSAESADAADERAADAAAKSPLNARPIGLLNAAAAAAVRLTVSSAA